jgi:hypothetical protein
MLNLQEIVEKTKPNVKRIKECLDAGSWHPSEASIYDGLNLADRHDIKETMDSLSLSEFLQLTYKTTGDAAGAYWLVASKVYDTLINYSKISDKIPYISAYVATAWKGADLVVDIANDYQGNRFVSGALHPTETVTTKKATCTMVSFGVSPHIGSDLIEDAQFDMVEWHVRQAAVRIGEMATSQVLPILATASDGWNTVGAVTADTGETKWNGSAGKDIHEATATTLGQGFVADTLITTADPWHHSLYSTLEAGAGFMPRKDGFSHCIDDLDIILHPTVADLTGAGSKYQTVVFDRKNALLTARKRWMQLENYSDPVRGLAGVTITCRQDAVTLYNNAITVMLEA